MRALSRLGGGSDDRVRELLVVAQAVLETVAVHLARAFFVHLQDRRGGGAGEIIAHHDLDRHHAQALAHQHVGIGIFDDVIGTEALRGLEPETRGLRQHLPFQRDHGEVAVEGAHPIGGDENARAVSEIVVLAHLAAVIAGKLGDDGVGQDVMCVGSELGRVDHWG